MNNYLVMRLILLCAVSTLLAVDAVPGLPNRVVRLDSELVDNDNIIIAQVVRPQRQLKHDKKKNKHGSVTDMLDSVWQETVDRDQGIVTKCRKPSKKKNKSMSGSSSGKGSKSKGSTRKSSTTKSSSSDIALCEEFVEEVASPPTTVVTGSGQTGVGTIVIVIENDITNDNVNNVVGGSNVVDNNSNGGTSTGGTSGSTENGNTVGGSDGITDNGGTVVDNGSSTGTDGTVVDTDGSTINDNGGAVDIEGSTTDGSSVDNSNIGGSPANGNPGSSNIGGSTNNDGTVNAVEVTNSPTTAPIVVDTSRPLCEDVISNSVVVNDGDTIQRSGTLQLVLQVQDQSNPDIIQQVANFLQAFVATELTRCISQIGTITGGQSVSSSTLDIRNLQFSSPSSFGSGACPGGVANFCIGGAFNFDLFYSSDETDATAIRDEFNRLLTISVRDQLNNARDISTLLGLAIASVNFVPDSQVVAAESNTNNSDITAESSNNGNETTEESSNNDNETVVESNSSAIAAQTVTSSPTMAPTISVDAVTIVDETVPTDSIALISPTSSPVQFDTDAPTLINAGISVDGINSTPSPIPVQSNPEINTVENVVDSPTQDVAIVNTDVSEETDDLILFETNDSGVVNENESGFLPDDLFLPSTAESDSDTSAETVDTANTTVATIDDVNMTDMMSLADVELLSSDALTDIANSVINDSEALEEPTFEAVTIRGTNGDATDTSTLSLNELRTSGSPNPGVGTIVGGIVAVLFATLAMLMLRGKRGDVDPTLKMQNTRLLDDSEEAMEAGKAPSRHDDDDNVEISYTDNINNITGIQQQQQQNVTIYDTRHDRVGSTVELPYDETDNVSLLTASGARPTANYNHSRHGSLSTLPDTVDL